MNALIPGLDDLALRDRRIRFIKAAMEDGQWRQGETARALAERWGTTARYVADLAAVASRRLRADLTG